MTGPLHLLMQSIERYNSFKYHLIQWKETLITSGFPKRFIMKFNDLGVAGELVSVP